MQANAWVYWQAIENSENGNWWGLMQVWDPPACLSASAACEAVTPWLSFSEQPCACAHAWLKAVHLQHDDAKHAAGQKDMGLFCVSAKVDRPAALLVQVPFHTGRSVTLGKQFYCLMQYSRFIRGGATILASSQHKSVLIAQTSAQQQQQERQFVVVATNALMDYDVVHFDLSECGGVAAEALLEVFRTSVKENCQKVVSVTAPTPLRFGCPLRPLSITTFVITFQVAEKSLGDIV